MGADLYILCERYRRFGKLLDEWSKKDPEDPEAKRLFEEIMKLESEMIENYEYFRDSYNSSNLLWILGLDYWNWFAQFVDNENIVNVENCKKILDEVRKRKDMITKERLKDLGFTNIDEWFNYFKEKYDRFIKFLEKCIECGGMYASI